MVHAADETRHDWPLRLGQAGTDAVVESHRIACSHFDAFRFFTPTAQPLNTLRPARDDRPDFEQPGCLHAGMDLYKHAFRLTPMISSDLVADCFELARDIRVLDMRAAPYDLADLGFEPVAIETTEGKAAYVEAQRGVRRARRAAAGEADRGVRAPALRLGSPVVPVGPPAPVLVEQVDQRRRGRQHVADGLEGRCGPRPAGGAGPRRPSTRDVRRAR